MRKLCFISKRLDSWIILLQSTCCASQVTVCSSNLFKENKIIYIYIIPEIASDEVDESAFLILTAKKQI